MLDRVLGPGNSTVQVTANLSFDKTVSETTRYFGNADIAALGASESSEILQNGDAGAAPSGGVVGPDGQMDTDAPGRRRPGSSYEKTDEHLGQRRRQDRRAPRGRARRRRTRCTSVSSSTPARSQGVDPTDVQNADRAALGIDPTRGDTIDVTAMPFDRTAEAAAARSWPPARRPRSKAADDGPDPQRRADRPRGADGAGRLDPGAAPGQGARRGDRATSSSSCAATRSTGRRTAGRASRRRTPRCSRSRPPRATQADEMRDEIAALVERQPEDVAALLRGWLVERWHDVHSHHDRTSASARPPSSSSSWAASARPPVLGHLVRDRGRGDLRRDRPARVDQRRGDRGGARASSAT